MGKIKISKIIYDNVVDLPTYPISHEKFKCRTIVIKTTWFGGLFNVYRIKQVMPPKINAFYDCEHDWNITSKLIKSTEYNQAKLIITLDKTKCI